MGNERITVAWSNIFCLFFRNGTKLTVPLGCLASRQKHTLPDLPYDYGALQPHISAEIMQLHHSKHHAAYVNNLNVAEEKYKEALAKGMEGNHKSECMLSCSSSRVAAYLKPTCGFVPCLEAILDWDHLCIYTVTVWWKHKL